MSITNHCIPADPDISGIGVRIAIYAQNFLGFIPALYALSDKMVTRTELDSLETQSTTILITAFAILISAVVQALTLGLSNFHASIVLNLSWMNNTNTFIYFLLYIHHKSVLEEGDKGDEESGLWSRPSASGMAWAQRIKMLSRDPVLVLGSLHLSLMAAVGIWLWSRPATFGSSSSYSCSMSTSVIIFGGGVSLASAGLRLWSLIIYSFLLLPGLNLIIPATACVLLYKTYNHAARRPAHHQMSIVPVHIGLIILAVINVIFVADTEASVRRNALFIRQDDSESDWTFGQTLALLLLLVPARDLVETFLERRKKQIEDAKAKEREKANTAKAAIATLDLFAALEKGGNSSENWERIKECIERGANIDVQAGIYGTALQAAALLASFNTVKFLVEKGADVNSTGKYWWSHLQDASHSDFTALGGKYGSALQAAAVRHGHIDIAKFHAEKGNQDEYFRTALQSATRWEGLDIIKLLVEKGADVNIQGGEYGTALQAAAANMDPVRSFDTVKFLVEAGADVNSQGGQFGSALQGAASRGSLDAVRFLLEKGASVNSGEYGTALQAAAYKGSLDIVKLLVENGADVNIRGGKYGSAYRAAYDCDKYDVEDFLTEKGATDSEVS